MVLEKVLAEVCQAFTVQLGGTSCDNPARVAAGVTVDT
ncbi:hypothetical protein PJE062_2759 [Pseudovibrio sp. JE062]|nr:hypothetical protein PJE062_2759 [Pseudovibrio sp. JE062]